MTNGTLTWDMIYHPTFQTFCEIFHYLVFFLTTTLTLSTIYVILKKSTEAMGFYKYILLNSIFWNYIVELYYFLWDLYKVTPYFLFYSNGILQYLLPSAFAYIFYIFVFLGISSVHAMFVSMLYRFSQVFIMSKLYDIFNTPKYYFIVHLVTWLSLETPVTSMFACFTQCGTNKARKDVASVL
jgi:hypothetical protein